MATYAESIREALNAYPDTDTFLHRRSKESVAAAKYLREKIRPSGHTPEDTLRQIVNFLLTGEYQLLPMPADLKKLKPGGKLYALLDAAQRGRVNKKLSEYDGTILEKMSFDPDAAGIDSSIRRKYDAAIERWVKHKVDGSHSWREKQEDTLASLLGLSRERHLQIIDNIYGDIIELHTPDRTVVTMVDPALSHRAFDSSHRLPRAFKMHGYAFRCDTRPPADVSAHGFRPLYQFRCPEDIKGTILERAARGEGMLRSLGFWKDNRDAVGEMTICVSRQMRGCTKFPEWDYEGAAWIYALGLKPHKPGFDTENWQDGLGGDALWRPGEKAFFDVQPTEVLASVPIWKFQARQDQANEYFRFQILSNQWEFYHAKPEQRRHLTQELNDLYNGGQIQSVMEDEDFYKDRADEGIQQRQPAARLAPPAQVGQVARAQGGQPPPVQGGPAPPAPVGPAPPAQGAQPPTFRCEQCNRTFPTRVLLSAHVKMQHKAAA